MDKIKKIVAAAILGTTFAIGGFFINETSATEVVGKCYGWYADAQGEIVAC